MRRVISLFSAPAHLVLLAALFASPFAVSAAPTASDDDPFAPDAKPDLAPATNPSAPAADLDSLRITIPGRGGVVAGPLNCPVIVVGNDVWNIKAGRVTAQLEGEADARGAILSDEGKYLVAWTSHSSKSSEPEGVNVWTLATGQLAYTIPIASKDTSLIAVSRNRYLIYSSRDTQQLLVWDLDKNAQAKAIDTKNARNGRGKTAFSPDGKFFAQVRHDELSVFQTANGAKTVSLAFPKAMQSRVPLTEEDAAPAPAPKPAPPPPGRPAAATPAERRRASAPGSADANDAVFIYAWLQSMAFSPDGREIAAVSTHPRPRLMTWRASGQLLYDEPLILPQQVAFWEHSVQWLPDKNAWLVTGNVVDRESKRVVLSVRKQFAQDIRVFVLDQEHLLGTFADSPSELVVRKIPWDSIRQSLKLMKEKGAALMSPADPVSIEVTLAGLRGDAEGATRLVTRALTARLAADGIRVAPGQHTTFRMRLAENAGDALPIYERQSPLDFRGKDTGRKATEAKGSLVIELVADSEKEPLWRDTVQSSSSRSFDEEINDATIRKSMLQNLTYQLEQLAIPYFIPKSEKEAALPMTLD